MQRRERQIIVIEANPTKAAMKKQSRKQRVAAYCRVSTDELEQLNSFEIQVENYTNEINKNPDWKLAGIFADEGISGKQAKNRPEFKRMISECRKGKIDLILVKSLSRFARNTVDCLQYVRQLKSYGVRVIFEKENIDTDKVYTELMFSIHAAFAQAESESTSRNVAVGIRHGYRLGIFGFPYNSLLGYKKGEDGEPAIVEEGAAVIRMIYTSFLDGDSYGTIKQKLEEKKILSPKGKEIWSAATVKNILQNEKYMGDVILQKSFITDFITGTKKANTGELPMYLIKNNHVPIISEKMFLQVQAEITKRRSKVPNTQKETVTKRGKHSGKYALTGKVICGDCGTRYRRVTWSIHGRKEIVWRCINRLEFGKKFCPESATIKETFLHEAVIKACNEYIENSAQMSSELNSKIISTANSNLSDDGTEKTLNGINAEIDKKNIELDRLIEMIANEDKECDFLALKIKQANDALSELRYKKTEIVQKQEKKQAEQEATDSIGDILLSEFSKIQTAESEFSNVLVSRIIKNVIVKGDKNVEVEFLDGIKTKV